MSSQPPVGEPAPADGSLPDDARTAAAQRPLSLYVHVPYCAVRCGYCDFNTYTAADLGSEPGTGQDAYLGAIRAELDLAVRVLGTPAVDTVFFGGGTPTVLAPGALAGILDAIRNRFPLAPDAEVTTEANPETVDAAALDALVAAGFTRLSLGMQSGVEHVLAVLERRHTPGQVPRVVAAARRAGFRDVSLDLIYASPGESPADWQASLDAAIALEPDHLSAYSLIVEPGTKLAARVARGELNAADDDTQADYYAAADAALSAAGYAWYEVSNWAKPGHECRHNLAYWRSGNWWGLGPGAHSHVEGVRWWNVRHPRDYTARLQAGASPAQGREHLDEAARHVERVMLGLRLAEGVEAGVLTATERDRLPGFVAGGLAHVGDRVRLTDSGRLLADAIVRDLLD